MLEEEVRIAYNGVKVKLISKEALMYNPQLDTFLKVADSGSFLKAAEQLYIPPPAVIQQINLLEARCGVTLFERTHRGVKLTPAGRIFYQDVKAVIRLCEDSLSRVKAAAGISNNTIRIGTSLLFKCRLLPKLCAEAGKRLPELSFELPPLEGPITKGNDFSDLGKSYDLLEGIYCTISWKGLCSFLELSRTPVCCAVSPGHRLAKAKKLTLQELGGECLVMPVANVSEELDAFRREITEKHPAIQIIDSHYYGLDTFTLCELNPYVLITQPVYSDIHPSLVTIPLENDYTLPYGIIYSNNPAPAVKKFLEIVQDLKESLPV